MKKKKRFSVWLYDKANGKQFVHSFDSLPSNQQIKNKVDSKYLLDAPPHHWETKWSGFNHEKGHWYYDKCRICGAETERYYQNAESKELKVDIVEKTSGHCNLDHCVEIEDNGEVVFAYYI